MSAEYVEDATSSYLDHWAFPHPPRPQQEDVLNELSALDPEIGIVLCNAPTGTGKSPINVTIASRDSGIILTPQKILQDQYGRDWPDVPILKGAANYPCEMFRGADCQVGRAAKCREASCGYKAAKSAFLDNPVSITNYAYFFAAITTPGFDPQHKWLLMDEGHELEGALINAAEVHITQDIIKWIQFYDLPWPVDFREAREFLAGMLAPIEIRISQLMESVVPGDGSAPNLNPGEAKQLATLEHLGHTIENCLTSSGQGEEWVYIEHGEDDEMGFRIRPLYARSLYEQLVAPLGKRVWITSATMPPVRQMARWLGIEPSICHRMDLDSPFHVDNRAVRYTPAARMDRANLQQGLGPMAARIDKLLTHYKEFKGVIHTHSFYLTKELEVRLGKHRARLLVHRQGTDRQKLLDEHYSSSEPTVLMSPSITEGLDLKDDLSRFTIFPKIPFPNMGDQWVRQRMDSDSEWFNWQTLKALMQGCGRSVRHDQDWADAWILDASFERFWQRTGSMAPKWFSDSLIMK